MAYKREKTSGFLFKAILLLIIAGCCALGVWFYFFYANPRSVPAFDEHETNLVIEAEVIKEPKSPRILNNEILLPFDTIKKYIDQYISWDEKLKKVTITTKDRVIRMKTDSLTAHVNNKPMTLNVSVIEENDAIYVPIEFLSDFYNIKIDYNKQNNVVIIDFKNSLVRLARPLEHNVAVRSGRTRFHPYVKQLSTDESVRIFEEYEKWYKVRTEDGIAGYVQKKDVVVKTTYFDISKIRDNGNEHAFKPESGKINVVWEQIYSGKINTNDLQDMHGVDVISPTWFSLLDEEGNVLNRGDLKFTEWAHSKGYAVWALAANNFTDIQMTSKMLNNADARDNYIRQLLAYAALYKLDGINIDFEGMSSNDRQAFTQFVREAVPLLKEQGLVVSVDINTAACYDRKELANVADYIMVMTYDQHWKGSKTAGSVAQIAWVENLLQKYLEDIPKSKLLLGIPFYTRLWKEEKNADGTINLSSQAISMKVAKEFISQNNIKPVWQKESGQFYAEIEKDGAVYKLWLEDENSINLRCSLVHKYSLAGCASWSRNFAEPVIWDVLKNNMKDIENYSRWQEVNAGKYVDLEKNK